MSKVTYDPSIPYNLVQGSRVRIVRLVAEVTSLSGLQPKLGARKEEFTCTVLGIYGDHPTAPTLIEVKVKRDDTGEEVYCAASAIAEVLPEDPQPVDLASTGTWFRRRLTSAVDSALGEVLIVDDNDQVIHLTGSELESDEVDIEV